MDNNMSLEEEVTELRQEMEQLKVKLETVQDTLNTLLRFNPMAELRGSAEAKSAYHKDNSLDNKDLSLVICKYKKSVLVKSKYEDRNTTKKCKEELKEIEGKWFKNGENQGWLFVGAFKSEKTLEENSRFIVENLKEHKFNVEVEYSE